MADNRVILLAFDAENKQILAQVTENDGTVVSAWGSVKLTLGKDPGTNPIDPGHNMGQEIKFMETQGTDETGADCWAMFLRSPSYSAKKTGDDPDFRGGGSGGGVQMYRLKSVQGDYLTCRTWDGTTEGGTDVFIAKNYKLRNSITSQVIDGVTVNYSYTTTVERDAVIGANTETQVVVPRYLEDDLIFAISANHTEVDKDSVELTLLDINADGRAWALKAE